MPALVLIAIIGLAGGILSGMFGIGGGLVMLLVGGAAATVAAGRTAETIETVSTVHVDIAPLDRPAAAQALRLDTIVGTDAERRLRVEGLLQGTGSTPISFRGSPDVTTLTVSPDMADALLVETFAGPDGAIHVIRAEVHATAAVETWMNGPFAASIDGAMAALRTCRSNAVPAAAVVTIDGVPVGLTGFNTIADIVVRECSTVALYR